MKCCLAILVLLVPLRAPGGETTRVTVLDFEKPPRNPPKVWVVNIPDGNASVGLSPDDPREGKGCLELRYRFVAGGSFQYLGIPNQVRIHGPIHGLRYWIRGDGSRCSYGLQVTDVGGETHQYRSLSTGAGQGGVIDFTGWKEVVFDLEAPHETWGGDGNGKMDGPIAAVIFTIGQPAERAGGAEKLLAAEGRLAFDGLSVDSARSAGETLGGEIAVASPAYGSEVRGEVTISLAAPGFLSVTARCWMGGEGQGSDSTVATIVLDAQGGGSFVFPAGRYPHGPIALRIHGENGTLKDNCYLQLYNLGGAPWKQGIPKDPPPAAAGMSQVFADDFDGPLSISSTDTKVTYYDHKPPGGYQDFSVHAFSGHGGPKDPFARIDTWLRIRASDELRSSGLISSMKNDATGITARAPCYFECRLLGPNAIGSWPAFWLMTDYMTDYVQGKGDKTGCDELDVIEAYGGEGPGHPNADDGYMVTPHRWNQGEEGKAEEKKAFEGLRNPIRMRRAGIPSTWFEAFHDYGCKVTRTDTIYYCDDIEVGRHPTFPLSKEKPIFFMVNLATGGGWPVDLSRYGRIDLYVDYVRVYQGKD